jgi:hypothetical protein
VASANTIKRRAAPTIAAIIEASSDIVVDNPRSEMPPTPSTVVSGLIGPACGKPTVPIVI